MQRRHEIAIEQLKQISETCEQTPPRVWLRCMAHARRTLAGIYLEASNGYHPDSIEWHGLRECALLLESHAVSNLTSARLHDTYAQSTQESDE